jgi:hypothetical protein
MSSSSDRTNVIAWDLIIVAMILVGIYYVLVAAHDGFGLADFSYFSNSGAYMLNIPTPFVRAQFWKIMFLLPATILATVALVKAGVRFRFPSGISSRLAVGGLMAMAAVVLVMSTQLLFHETGVTDDESTFDFQAQTLLLGRVVNPPPPVANSFQNTFIINDGKIWAGKYTLGHPLIIAIGMALGDRYLLTITFSVLTLLLIYLIALKLFEDKTVARLALLLGALSPFFYLVSSTRLSHTTTAFFLALFVYLYLRARSTNETSMRALFPAFLAGIALGYAFNVRSLTALGFSVPFCVVGMIDLRQRIPGTLAKALSLAAGFAVMLVFTLGYNSVVTGNALTFPFHYYDSSEMLGFGANGHTFFASIRNLAVSVGRLNSIFLGFPISLLCLFLVVILPKRFGDYVSLGILGSIAFAYIFYYSPGVSDVGPVYYYETIIPLLLLTARVAMFLHRWFSEHLERGNAVVPNFLAVSVLLALITFVPEEVSHIRRLTTQIRSPYEFVRTADIHHALVLTKMKPNKGWVFGFKNPSPDFTDDIVYARFSDSTSNVALLKYFQDRAPFILDGDGNKEPYRLIPADPGALKSALPQ